MTYRSIIFASFLLLSGCAHQLDLLSRSNSGNGTGQAQEMGKTITLYLKGKTYVGTYVHDGLKMITTTARANTSSNTTAIVHSGNRSASAYGYGNSNSNSNSNSTAYATTYIPGSGNGSFVATSGDDTIRCEFNYSSGSGIGYCQNNSGEEYDLIIR